MKLATGTAGKAAIVVGGSGVGGYGMYALATGEQSTNSKEKQGGTEWAWKITPELEVKMKDFEAENEDYFKISGSFGYAFERFMLKPSQQDQLWTEREKNAQGKADATGENSLSDEFKAVKGTDNREGKSLKTICKEVYEKTKTTVTIDGKLLNDTWQFCSIVGSKLESVREADWSTPNKYDGKWAALFSNSNALLNSQESESGKKNSEAWKHVYEKILKVDKENDSKKNTLDQKFSSIDSGEALSKECQRAYESTPSVKSSNYGNNAIYYCVLDESISLSQYPTA